MQNVSKETVLEVVATVALMVAVVCNSLNIYPINLYINLVGNGLWLLLGFVWNKKSLIIIQALILIIYLFGLGKYLLS